MTTINLLDRAKAAQIMWKGILKSACDARDDNATRLAWKEYCKATEQVDFLTGGSKPCEEIDPELWVMVINDFTERFKRAPYAGEWRRKACIAYLRTYGRVLAGYEEGFTYKISA